MANQEKIDQLIGESAFAQIDKLKSQLDQTQKKFIDCVLSAEKLNVVLAKSSSFKELEASAKNSNAEMLKMQKLQDQAVIIEERKKQAIMRTAEIQAKSDRAKAISEQKIIDIENNRIVALNKKRKAIISNSQLEIDAYNNTVNGSKKVNSTINEQNKAYAAASSQAAGYVSATKKVTTETLKVKPASIDAQKSINSLKIQLQSYQNIAANAVDPKTISSFNLKAQETEATIGRLSNVGKKGFDEFGNAIVKSRSGLSGVWQGLKTVANILPGVGIAGLLAFASEPILNYVKSLDLFKAKIDQIKETRKQLNDVNLKGAQDAQLEIIQLKTLYDTAKNISLTSDQRYNAAKKLQQQYPETFKNYSIEQMELGKVDAGYLKLTESILATARARASQEKIAENSSRQLNNEQIITDAIVEYDKQRLIARTALTKLKDPANSESARFLAAEAARAEEKKSIAAKTIRDAKKDSLILDQRNLKLTENIVAQQIKGADLADPSKLKKDKPVNISVAEIGTRKAEVEALRDAQKAIIDDEQKSLDLRFDALVNYTLHVKQINALDSEEKIKKAKGDSRLIAQANAELNTANKKSDIDTAALKLKINEKANQDLKKLLDEGKQQLTQKEKDEIAVIESANREKLENIELFRSQAVQGVAEQYAEGIINKKQYEQQLLDLEAQAAKDRIQVEIDGLKEIIAKEKDYLIFGIGTNQQLGADEKKLSQLEISLSKLTTDAKIKDKEKVAEAAKRLRDTEIELGREVLTFGIALVDGMFVTRINAIQSEKDAIEEKKNFDVENVNNEVLSEEDKANKIAIINATAAAQQSALDQKIRQEKVRQAKFDKAASIANIIANTAVAVMKTYADFGFPVGVPLALAQGAIGAVQIATVLATPIPQYKYGKKKGDNYSGPAIVGDGYEHELRIEKNGEMSLTPNIPTLTTVSAGTQIIGGEDFKRLISKPPTLEAGRYDNGYDLKALIAAQENGNKKLIKAFSKQKPAKGPSINFYGLGDYMTRNFN